MAFVGAAESLSRSLEYEHLELPPCTFSSCHRNRRHTDQTFGAHHRLEHRVGVGGRGHQAVILRITRYVSRFPSLLSSESRVPAVGQGSSPAAEYLSIELAG